MIVDMVVEILEGRKQVRGCSASAPVGQLSIISPPAGVAASLALSSQNAVRQFAAGPGRSDAVRLP
jgi:hypothetical protein